MSLLVVENLHVSVEDQPILKGVNLVVEEGKIHALMGPNGSGKSTLSNVLMGNPAYEVTEGRVIFKGKDITEAAPEERARAGMFLAFQYPVEVPGVSVSNFMRTALNSVREKDTPVREFMAELRGTMSELGMDPVFASRSINEGFSGGEKKRNEILQFALLKPSLAILDETDSGLDIDAVRIVSENVSKIAGPNIGVLIITHYTRILKYIKPDVVHVLLDGQIVKSGGSDLADQLEATGYDPVKAEFPPIAS